MLVPGGQFQSDKHQDAATATGNGKPLWVTAISQGAYGVWTVQLTGTFSATVAFEGTVDGEPPELDGATWVPVEMTSVGDAATVATTATAAGIWRGNVLGLTAVRARVSAYTSGNVTVVGQVVA